MVKNLVENGIAPSYVDIADTLEWDRSAMSNVINHRRDVPNAVYKRFTEVYKPIEIKDSEATTQERLLRMDATTSVILSAIAEILSYHRNQAVSKVMEDLVSTVNSKLKQMTGK